MGWFLIDITKPLPDDMLIIPPASTKLKGGYTCFTLCVRPSVRPSLRLSVCPSVDKISFTLHDGILTYFNLVQLRTSSSFFFFNQNYSLNETNANVSKMSSSGFTVWTLFILPCRWGLPCFIGGYVFMQYICIIILYIHISVVYVPQVYNSGTHSIMNCFGENKIDEKGSKNLRNCITVSGYIGKSNKDKIISVRNENILLRNH